MMVQGNGNVWDDSLQVAMLNCRILKKRGKLERCLEIILTIGADVVVLTET